MQKATALSKKNIVITRPEKQAGQIAGMLEAQYANVTLFPVIDIEARKTLSLNCDEATYDWFIYISVNAVEYGLPLIRSCPEKKAKVAAIGKKTAEKLELNDCVVDLFPSHTFNSEVFLQLPEMQSVRGQRFLIIRGEGGRELLANTLRNRGADVDYAEVYRRVIPDINAENLYLQWRSNSLDVIVLTSSEGLKNLYKMAHHPIGGDWVSDVPVLLGSQKMLEMARHLKHRGQIIMSENPSDEAVMSALVQWAGKRSA